MDLLELFTIFSDTPVSSVFDRRFGLVVEPVFRAVVAGLTLYLC